jgi:hypothetical protein
MRPPRSSSRVQNGGSCLEFSLLGGPGCLAGFARAANRTARAAARTPRSDDPDRRPERPIAKRCAQLRAEFEAELAAYAQAANKAEGPRAKGAVTAKRSIDLILWSFASAILGPCKLRRSGSSEEVIAEYGDVPHIERRHRELLSGNRPQQPR